MAAPLPLSTFPAVGQSFGRLANALRGVIDAYGPPWADGGPALRDCQRDEQVEGTPYLTSMLMVSFYLNHAEDHLRAMARLAGEEQVLMGCFTLTRPVLGSASRAMWLLDQSVSATERLRRGMNFQLTRLWELRNLLRDHDVSAQQALDASNAATAEDIERQARAEGLPRMTKSKLQGDGTTKSAFHIGTAVPRDMELIRQLMDREPSAPTGSSIFRISSAFVHGEYHVQDLLSQRPTGTSTHGAAGYQYGIRLDNFISYVASVLLGVHHVALAALRYAGLPDEVWERLAQPEMQQWQTALNVVRSSVFRDEAGD